MHFGIGDFGFFECGGLTEFLFCFTSGGYPFIRLASCVILSAPVWAVCG